MTSFKSTLLLFFTAAILLLVATACADTEPTRLAILESMDQDMVAQQSTNRSIETIVEDSEILEVSFSVVYTGDLDQILFNSSSHLRAIIDTYELQLSDPFEIDGTMKGIVLSAYELLDDPLEIAKEISQCAEVLMVEAKNLPEITGLAL